jgi:hypothetical protein
MASFSEPKVVTEIAGPKVSSVKKGISGDTPVKIVGSM